MSVKNLRPKVGVAAIVRDHNSILLGKRLSKHAKDFWGPPGGHLEFGESFEQCALRELEEETGLIGSQAHQLAVYNTVYHLEQQHYVIVFMEVAFPHGQEPVLKEPEKCAGWSYFNLDQLPSPLMIGFKMLLEGDLL